MPNLFPISSSLRRLAGFAALLSASAFMNAHTPPPVPADASSLLVWHPLPDIPEAIGFKGMYAGASRGRVLLAGGSNFPVPAREGGRKNLGREIFVREIGDDAGAWTIAKQMLPVGLAEGTSVTVDEEVICLGGIGTAGAVRRALALSWDDASGEVRIREFPALPAPRANGAAAVLGRYLYLAGGDTAGQGKDNFWRLNLDEARTAPESARWEALPTWPGPARFGAVLAVLEVQGRPCLFLFGGRTKAVGTSQISEYLSDGYRHDPETNKWKAIGNMPDRALLSGALRLDRSRLAVMGGSNGHSLERMVELGERYRIPSRIMIYDATTDRWEKGGDMPIGVVAPAVVSVGDGWIVAGGEYSPGLRTPVAFRATLAPSHARSKEVR